MNTLTNPAVAADLTPLPPPETPGQRLRREFFANKLAVMGLVLLLLAIGVAVLAPWISPQNPYDIGKLDIFDSKLPPGSKDAAGHRTYGRGTDSQGSDRRCAIFYGPGPSLMVGGSWAVALPMAAWTSWPAAWMFRSRANCKVTWVSPRAFTELIESRPAMVENCFSRGVATEAAMVSGLAPGRTALT